MRRFLVDLKKQDWTALKSPGPRAIQTDKAQEDVQEEEAEDDQPLALALPLPLPQAYLWEGPAYITAAKARYTAAGSSNGGGSGVGGTKQADRWKHQMVAELEARARQYSSGGSGGEGADKAGPFSDEEDMLLLVARLVYGNKWQNVEKAIPGRTAGAIKKHWHSTMRERYKRTAWATRLLLAPPRELTYNPRTREFDEDYYAARPASPGGGGGASPPPGAPPGGLSQLVGVDPIGGLMSLHGSHSAAGLSAGASAGGYPQMGLAGYGSGGYLTPYARDGGGSGSRGERAAYERGDAVPGTAGGSESAQRRRRHVEYVGQLATREAECQLAGQWESLCFVSCWKAYHITCLGPGQSVCIPKEKGAGGAGTAGAIKKHWHSTMRERYKRTAWATRLLLAPPRELTYNPRTREFDEDYYAARPASPGGGGGASPPPGAPPGGLSQLVGVDPIGGLMSLHGSHSAAGLSAGASAGGYPQMGLAGYGSGGYLTPYARDGGGSGSRGERAAYERGDAVPGTAGGSESAQRRRRHVEYVGQLATREAECQLAGQWESLCFVSCWKAYHITCLGPGQATEASTSANSRRAAQRLKARAAAHRLPAAAPLEAASLSAHAQYAGVADDEDEWMHLVEGIRPLPTNNGGPTVDRLRKAKAKAGAGAGVGNEDVVDALEHAISPAVYKSNSAGATKHMALQALDLHRTRTGRAPRGTAAIAPRNPARK
eukprot:jgi/Mesen1/506/ME000104S10600